MCFKQANTPKRNTLLLVSAPPETTLQLLMAKVVVRFSRRIFGAFLPREFTEPLRPLLYYDHSIVSRCALFSPSFQ
jgi:hypothetical protein